MEFGDDITIGKFCYELPGDVVRTGSFRPVGSVDDGDFHWMMDYWVVERFILSLLSRMPAANDAFQASFQGIFPSNHPFSLQYAASDSINWYFFCTNLIR